MGQRDRLDITFCHIILESNCGEMCGDRERESDREAGEQE